MGSIITYGIVENCLTFIQEQIIMLVMQIFNTLSCLFDFALRFS